MWALGRLKSSALRRMLSAWWKFIGKMESREYCGAASFFAALAFLQSQLLARKACLVLWNVPISE